MDRRKRPADGLNYVVSDGQTVHLRNLDGFLDDMAGHGQRSFAFVVNVANLREEVRARAPDLKPPYFSMRVRKLRYEIQALRRVARDA